MMVFCPAEVGRIKLMERKREHALLKINTMKATVKCNAKFERSSTDFELPF